MKYILPFLLVAFLLTSCTEPMTHICVGGSNHSRNGCDTGAEVIEPLPDDTAPTDHAPQTTFRENFYSISSLLLTPLEQSGVFEKDKLSDWETYANLQTTDDPYLINNIYYFLRFFEIPRDTLENLYYSTDLYYQYDFDFDLLYGDDVEAVYAYYRGNNEDFTKRSAEYTLKDRMKEYVGEDTFDAWAEETHHSTSIIAWSISEAIYAFDIPRADMESLIAGETDEIEPIVEEVYEDGTTAVISGKPMYTYDLDLIYSVDSLSALLAVLGIVETDGLDGYQIDMLIRE